MWLFSLIKIACDLLAVALLNLVSLCSEPLGKSLARKLDDALR
jgi:hypothetical protein